VFTIKKSASYKIGLAGAVEIIVGTVIGSGIYIMIGPLAVATGPGLFLCYFTALIVAVTSSICYAQVASVFPATAATYRYAKMFYSDFIGFVIGWMRLVGSFCGLALMSSGFAGYLSVYLDLDSRLVAAAVLTAVLIVNLLGIRTTQRVVQFLVVAVIAGLAVFSGFGIFKVQPDNLTPLWGPGIGPVLKGSMSAFYAYTGLYIVAEVGDEVENPQKNIPKSIIIASAIVGFLYLVTTLVFTGGLGWDTIKAFEPNLAQASALLENPWAPLIQVCAMVAIITPMNAAYMASSRSLYSLATDGIMPPVFSRLNRYNAPGFAIVTIYIFALIMIVFDLPVLFLGTISSIVILGGMTLVAGACLTIKKRYPEDFQSAPFRLSDFSLRVLPVFTIISAVLLTVVSLAEDPLMLYSFGFWLVLGIGYYYLRRISLSRKRQLKGNG
jgi:APA family basic amino acid/polyamine antiporter